MTMTAGRTLMGIDRFSTRFVSDRLSYEMAKIIRQHAIASTLASTATVLPGAGTVACLVAQTAIVYTLYVRINSELGLRLNNTIVKSIAAAVISNISANTHTVIASVAAATALSMIPGFGSAASAIVMCGLSYATIMIAGLVSAKTLTSLTKSNRTIENIFESEIEQALKDELDKRDLNKDIRIFLREYKAEKKTGAFENAEGIVLEVM